VAVVTGGSRGIGREIAADFARAGAQTVIVSSLAENFAAASRTIAAGGPVPLAITADLRTLDGCQHVFDSVKDSSIAATYWFARPALPERETSPNCLIRLG
jgi:NAD(P)-dependent dehydrogenase (short-subunit alcohol dehydrogenase family)